MAVGFGGSYHVGEGARNLVNMVLSAQGNGTVCLRAFNGDILLITK